MGMIVRETQGSICPIANVSMWILEVLCEAMDMDHWPGLIDGVLSGHFEFDFVLESLHANVVRERFVGSSVGIEEL